MHKKFRIRREYTTRHATADGDTPSEPGQEFIYERYAAESWGALSCLPTGRFSDDEHWVTWRTWNGTWLST
ncbi:hypothetical protein FRC20_006914, partial [Serendipita sp. 405]